MKYVTVSEAAEMVGVTTWTIHSWIRSGKLTEYRTPGGHRRVDPDELVRPVEVERPKPIRPSKSYGEMGRLVRGLS